MYMSGVMIGMIAIIIQAVQVLTQQDLIAGPTVFCVVVVGTSIAAAVVLQLVLAAFPIAVTAAAGFVSFGLIS